MKLLNVDNGANVFHNLQEKKVGKSLYGGKWACSEDKHNGLIMLRGFVECIAGCYSDSCD